MLSAFSPYRDVHRESKVCRVCFKSKYKIVSCKTLPEIYHAPTHIRTFVTNYNIENRNIIFLIIIHNPSHNLVMHTFYNKKNYMLLVSNNMMQKQIYCCRHSLRYQKRLSSWSAIVPSP